MSTDLNDDNEEVKGTLNDSKLSRLEEIANSAEEVRAQDLADMDQESMVDTSDTEPEEDVVEPEVAEPPRHKLKVNGKEQEKTLEELIAIAQKVSAADEYLAQAKRTFEQSKPQLPVQDVVDVGPSDEDKALARALQMGDESEAASAIRNLRAKAPSINMDEVIARTKDNMRFEEATSWFKDEYKDIFSDPDLLQLAITKDEHFVQAGDIRPYRDRYKEIGDGLRAKFGKATGLESKQERKASSVKVIPTASARASVERDEEPDDSPSALIAKMAQARGQRI